MNKEILKTQINGLSNERDIVGIGIVQKDYALQIYKTKKDKIRIVTFDKKHFAKTELTNNQIEYLANMLNEWLERNKKGL